jgi:hypothetical protein
MLLPLIVFDSNVAFSTFASHDVITSKLVADVAPKTVTLLLVFFSFTIPLYANESLSECDTP